MNTFTFYNEVTGRTKTVTEFRLYDALQKCRSERGWKLVSCTTN